jgi:hypothetical protein
MLQQRVSVKEMSSVSQQQGIEQPEPEMVDEAHASEDAAAVRHQSVQEVVPAHDAELLDDDVEKDGRHEHYPSDDVCLCDHCHLDFQTLLR